ncbi:MAG: copper homeostasis membrane protein CopD [Novosphingobium sp.]|uniref:copper homeostasis membrane protein CopD n=1 Tax=Sphingomonadales TaxID=204457 RepID=UPI00123B9887|nr:MULTISPECIES: copper homeostasis membrane protein CopD [Sphingomonadaceae]MPS71439.1 copper homeostasis membrane protein CopD [Novosphingobium sp.]
MPDWSLVAVRWGLYLALGALFGLPAFSIYGLPRVARATALTLRLPVIALSGIGVALSAAAILLMTAAMSGVGVMAIDRATLTMILTQTSIGWAWIARVVGLFGILLLAFPAGRWTRIHSWCSTVLAAIAVASLAWTGHGAAGEGALGTVQLVGDIIHLLAASAWVGALVAFLMLMSAAREPEALAVAHAALTGFSRAGTIIVGLLIGTGLLNLYILVGPDRLLALGASDYGRLLLAKLALFGLMLVLAAGHRWRLAPALGNDPGPAAIARLRTSLWLEYSAALAILAAVAWLGTLAPPSAL